VSPELDVTDRAPDFELVAHDGERHHLRDLRGQPVVLIFYPMDFDPVSTEEHACYIDVMTQLDVLDAQVLGISVDHRHAHRAFAEAGRIAYPLLADFHPKGQVGRQYGAYDDELGVHRRWTFVIDPEGRISHIQKNEFGEVPDVEEIVRAVEESL